jgi:hippurate hydrolase
MAAETILALQTIASRERSPLDPVVVTVGKIEGGTKRNIIPDEVRLFLTVRTFSPEVRKRVLASIERIPKGIALVAGVPDDRAPVFEPLPGESVDSTFNDPALTDRVVGALGRELGNDNVVHIDPAMVSEDFGRFGDGGKIPTVLLALGAADPAKLSAGTQPGLHSSKFAPFDPSLVLRTGVRGAVSMVLELLRTEKR